MERNTCTPDLYLELYGQHICLVFVADISYCKSSVLVGNCALEWRLAMSCHDPQVLTSTGSHKIVHCHCPRQIFLTRKYEFCLNEILVHYHLWQSCVGRLRDVEMWGH